MCPVCASLAPFTSYNAAGVVGRGCPMVVLTRLPGELSSAAPNPCPAFAPFSLGGECRIPR